MNFRGMKINWCAFTIHKWKYNEEETERTCVKCKKIMRLYSEPPLSAFSNPDVWLTVKKAK
jgi:hypothetical protein